MFRLIFCMFTGIALTMHCVAQSEQEPTKKFDHYVGVQVNQLVRQIINLNNNNTDVNNPYLLTYSIQSRKLGFGLSSGFGFNYEQFKDEESPANHESKISNFFYRVGIEKKFAIGKRFIAGCSVDYIGDYQMDKTFTFLVTDFGSGSDSSATMTTTQVKSNGAGLQLNLGYYITNRLLITTESTFYFMKSKEKHNVMVSEIFQFPANPESDSQTLAATNSATDRSHFSMTLPIALFLVLKF